MSCYDFSARCIVGAQHVIAALIADAVIVTAVIIIAIFVVTISTIRVGGKNLALYELWFQGMEGTKIYIGGRVLLQNLSSNERTIRKIESFDYDNRGLNWLLWPGCGAFCRINFIAYQFSETDNDTRYAFAMAVSLPFLFSFFVFLLFE